MHKPILHCLPLPFSLIHLLTLLLGPLPACRINSKLREKGKKEESRRLREFVDAAYKLDPRVMARRELQAAER